MPIPDTHDRGSTLIEALVATFLLTTAVLTMAQLMSSAARSNFTSRQTTRAVVLAGQKLEELRALSGLQASPPGALQQNTAGFVDYLETTGSAARSLTPDTVFTRRWSIEQQTVGGIDSVLIQVLVTTERGGRSVPGGVPGDVRLATFGTRGPS